MILNKYATTLLELQAKARRVALGGLDPRCAAMDGIYRRFGAG